MQRAKRTFYLLLVIIFTTSGCSQIETQAERRQEYPKTSGSDY
jgi:uncharacterized protein YceK